MSVPVRSRTLRRKNHHRSILNTGNGIGQSDDNASASHASCDENMMELLCNSVKTLTTDEHDLALSGSVYNESMNVHTEKSGANYEAEKSSSSVFDKENLHHRQYHRESLDASFESSDSNETDLLLNPYSPARIKYVASMRRALANPPKGKYVNWNNQVPQVYYSPPKKLISYSRKISQNQGKLSSRYDVTREGKEFHKRKPRRKLPPLP